VDARSAENQTALGALHKKLIDCENARVQSSNKAERAEADAFRLEKEAEAERVLQEQVERAADLSTRLAGSMLAFALTDVTFDRKSRLCLRRTKSWNASWWDISES